MAIATLLLLPLVVLSLVPSLFSFPWGMTFLLFEVSPDYFRRSASIGRPQHGVHSLDTRHSLGPRDVVRRYLGLVSPVCCGRAARGANIWPFRRGLHLFFFIAPQGAYYWAVSVHYSLALKSWSHTAKMLQYHHALIPEFITSWYQKMMGLCT